MKYLPPNHIRTKIGDIHENDLEVKVETEEGAIRVTNQLTGQTREVAALKRRTEYRFRGELVRRDIRIGAKK